MAATHLEAAGHTLCGRSTACGQRILLLTIGEPSEVTCKQCLHKLNAPKLVGQNRSRDQHQLRCVGGPWAGQDVVFPKQESGRIGQAALSLPVRVGEHVGRYNLNTGHWVPMEQRS